MEKKRQNWLIGLLLIATMLLFVPGITGRFSDYQSEIWNLGHIGYFFLLISLLNPLLERHLSSHVYRLMAALLVTLLLSATIETIQDAIGRMASFDDLLNNLVGCLLALYFCHYQQMRRAIFVFVLLILLLVWRLMPLLSITADAVYAEIKHPVVADFETPFELLRWGSDFPMEIVQDKSNQLLVHLKPQGKYPRATLIPRVMDWRGYSSLKFEIFNSGDQTWQLHLRINDQKHDEMGMHYNDRYNSSQPINPGWNQFQVDLKAVQQAPKNRQMDMEQISKVIFFFMDEPTLTSIRLDNLILVND
jgi:VanZ family protein